jgi:hypothetical protein
MYCVNCGVKLADTEKSCPLCGTAVFHPHIQRPNTEPLYPENRMPQPQRHSRGGQIILTAMFLLPLLICLQCDLLIKGCITWSGYVAGALVLAYVVLVLPQWFRRRNPVVFCGVDFAAVGFYLWYINFATAGEWFFSFALPVTGALGLLSTTVAALLRYVPRGALYTIGGALTALGAFMPLMESLLCLTFPTIRFLGWSLYPLTALVILGGTLIFLAINRRAREKMQRKFFL